MNLSQSKDKAVLKHAQSNKLHLKHSSKFISLLIVLVSLAIIIAVTIGTAYRIVFEHEQAVNRRMQLNANVAISIEQQIINVLQRAEQIAAFTANIYIDDLIDLKAWLAHELLLDKDLFSIGIINSNGALIASRGVDIGVSDYSSSAFFYDLQNNKSNSLLIDRPIFDEQQQQWLLPLYRRIENHFGEFSGAVMLTISPMALANFFKDMNLSTAFIELINTKGVVVSRVLGNKLVLNNDAKNVSWNARYSHADVGSYIDSGKSIDGISRVLAFRKIDGYDLFITVGTSYPEALAMADARRESHIIMGVLINSLVIIIALVLIFLLRRQDKAVYATQANEALFRATFHHAAMGIARIAPDGRILETNTKFQRMLGYSGDELLNKDIVDLLSESDRPGAHQFMHDRLTEYYLGMPPEIERAYVNKNGKKIWVHEALSVVRQSDGTADFLVSAIQDITDRKILEEQLSYAASHDSLTKLPNRTMLQHRLTQAINIAKENRTIVAVAFLDLNGFKKINDTYGHRVGDELLKNVGQRLKNTVRTNSGDIVARYGGDEFCIVLVNLKDIDNCERVANKIASVLEQPFDLGIGGLVTITTSIGAAFYPDNSETIDELISQADYAMYYAKNNGLTYSHWQDTEQKLDQLKVVVD